MGWPFESHPLKFHLRACPISGSDKLCPPGYFVRPFELLTRADLLSIGLFGLFLARTYLLEAYWISEYLNCPCDGPSHNKFWSACNFIGLFNLLYCHPDLIYQGIVHVFLSDSCSANPRVRGPTVSFMFWSFAWGSMLAWWTRFFITATMTESAFKYLRICVMLLVYTPCRFVGVSFWPITVLSLCSTD